MARRHVKLPPHNLIEFINLAALEGVTVEIDHSPPHDLFRLWIEGDKVPDGAGLLLPDTKHEHDEGDPTTYVRVDWAGDGANWSPRYKRDDLRKTIACAVK